MAEIKIDAKTIGAGITRQMNEAGFKIAGQGETLVMIPVMVPRGNFIVTHEGLAGGEVTIKEV